MQRARGKVCGDREGSGELSINRACKLMEVLRQEYYWYLSGRYSARKTEDRQLTAKIKKPSTRAIVSTAREESGRNCAMVAIG